jgi:hypothetical protein
VYGASKQDLLEAIEIAQENEDESFKQIVQAREWLERQGLVKWTGEYQNGWPVYALTEEGKQASAEDSVQNSDDSNRKGEKK